MNAKFTNIAAALVCALALFSCDIGMSSSDKGSISMRLPDQSQLSGSASADSLDGISRSVSSGGSISAGAVDQFKVVVRNISSHESITQFVAPGSSITVDELEPGSWDVAIFGYETATGISELKYYGNARGIPVEGGETSSATVGLYNISANMPGFGFNVTPAANVNYAYINYSCDELGQNGEAFYSFDSYDSSYDPTKPLMPPLPIFMEPGYAYKATANFYDLSGKCLYKGTAQGTVPPTGGTIDGIQIPLAETFEIDTNGINGNMVLEQDSDDFYKQYITHNLNSNLILDLDNVKYRAVAKNCGMVPFVVTYDDYSCVFVRSVWHPVITPTLNVPSFTVQKGQTITVSPSFNPSAPRTWQVFGESATATDGFKLYTVTGSEHDAWTHALSCADPNADKVNFNDANKTLTGAAVGSNNFRWTVTVEPVSGGSGEPGTKNASTDFTATCVEAASSGGGGNGGGTSGSVVNLYVKQNGNDGNDGLSEDTAFKTIGAADKKITQLNDANANYVINIVDKLWQSNLSVDAEGNTQPLVISTASAKSITIKGTGSNEIDGQYDQEGQGTVMKFTTNVPVLIENITIKGGCASNTINGGCIFVSSTSNVTLGQGSNVVGGRIGDGKGGGVYVESGATFVIDANAQVDSASTSEVYLEPGAMVTVGKDFETPNTIPIASIRVRDDDYEESTALQVVDNPHSKTIYNNGVSYFGLIVPTDKTGHLYGYKIDNQGKIFYYNYN